MGERLLCKQEVIGSIPFTSTICCSDRAGRNRSGFQKAARASVRCFQAVGQVKRNRLLLDILAVDAVVGW